MSAAGITVTEQDLHRLERVVVAHAARDADACSALDSALAEARVVGSDVVPPTLVTMNSRVVCVDGAGRRREVTLVYPPAADASCRRVSALAPLGRALLGVFVGDAIVVDVRGHRSRLCVAAIVYQPEAAGDADL